MTQAKALGTGLFGLGVALAAIVGSNGCADALRLEPGGQGGAGNTSAVGGYGGGGGGAPVACESSSDCPEPTSVCDTVKRLCVECLELPHCAHKPGTVCDLGVCNCPGADEWCGPNECVDLQTDNANCGVCRHQCFGACNDGACADPWEPVASLDAPQARGRHVAVWTGTAMVVWGGSADTGTDNNLQSGGSYDFATFTWQPTSLVNAPSARQLATAVWTGDKMIVWGGRDGAVFLDDGGVFDPATNTWGALSATNAPTARATHTAVWTGTEMIVWGGADATNQLNSGGRYNPASDAWTPTSPLPAPAAPRQWHSAAWDGVAEKMLIYGGIGDGTTTPNIYLPGDGVPGGRGYNPGADTWDVLSQVGEPSARAYHSAVWDGARMLLFGGYNGTNELGNGFKYEGNTWAAFKGAAPSGRWLHNAIYLEGAARMVVFGGVDTTVSGLGTGAVYDPATNSWQDATPAALQGRYHSSAVSTGPSMIVWGGFNAAAAALQDGGVYTP